MIVIHHLGISQSERIIWLCEELGLEYDLRVYARDPTTRLGPAEYKALHPIGIAPVIEDGALKLAESGAIVEYIIHKHGDGRLALRPDHPEYANYLFWFHFANGTFLPAEITFLISRRLAGGNALAFETFAKRSLLSYRLLEERLGEKAYFGGDEFTAADVMMLFPLTTMRSFTARDLSGFPHLLAYLRRIGERPAYRRAMAKGDPGLTPLLD